MVRFDATIRLGPIENVVGTRAEIVGVRIEDAVLHISRMSSAENRSSEFVEVISLDNGKNKINNPIMDTLAGIRVADICWIALAELHRDWPERRDFSAKEIVDRAQSLEVGDPRAGLSPHIYQHNVANVAPSTAKYRMFLRTREGFYRLWRNGDPSHPNRSGKILPRREDLPTEYHILLDWYERTYSRGRGLNEEVSDPLLALRGEGREIWQAFGLDEYVRKERKVFFPDPSDGESFSAGKPGKSVPNHSDRLDRVWLRLQEWEGAEFRTATGLAVTFTLDVSGLWFYRNGKRINKRCVRSQVEEAIRRCPIEKTTEIRDLIDYPYLFAVLMDDRIRKGLY